nr:autotransporter-associated beta strand repeat-containing protein [Marinicella sp. W31]MDC2876178.1 autotransporter-associated beta strand repeat-containing protein [Marinicella sp. W31]
MTLGGATSLDLSGSGGVSQLDGTVNLAAPASADTFTLNADLVDGVGTGSVNVLGAGRTVLTGTNTYTGATTITDSATLALTGTGSIAASSGVNVGTSSTFDIADTTAGASIITLNGAGSTVLGDQMLTQTAANGAYAGVISGTGSMAVTTASTYTLLGNNTYTGDTQVLAGTLQLGNGGTSGAIVGNAAISSGATLAVNRSDVWTYDGTISGAGDFSQNGTGRTVLTGTNTYTGSTQIEQGTLALTGTGSFAASSGVNVGTSSTFDIADTTAGASIITLNGAGSTVLGDQMLTQTAANGTYAGVISGTGSMAVTTASTYTLLGNNTYTGDTQVLAGTLQLGNGGTSGAIVGDAAISSGATLAVNRSDVWTYDGTIGGAGSSLKMAQAAQS